MYIALETGFDIIESSKGTNMKKIFFSNSQPSIDIMVKVFNHKEGKMYRKDFTYIGSLTDAQARVIASKLFADEDNTVVNVDFLGNYDNIYVTSKESDFRPLT